MRNVVFFAGLCFCVALLGGCGGNNTVVAPLLTANNQSPTPTATPSPTIENAPEPNLGTFDLAGTRAGVSLLVSDNTVERGIMTGAIDNYAPNGWKFDSDSWHIPQTVITLNERIADGVVSTTRYANPIRLRFPSDTTLTPGSVLSRGIYWLAPDGYNTFVNRTTGFVWEMRGGQILIEENGMVADQPTIKRLRLRLSGVRMEPPSTTGSGDTLDEIFPAWQTVANSGFTAYFPGSGTFTFNGVIVLERDTTFSTIYTYTGATSPYTL